MHVSSLPRRVAVTVIVAAGVAGFGGWAAAEGGGPKPANPKPLVVTGSVEGLYPSGTTVLHIAVTNDNTSTVAVASVTVEADDARPGFPAAVRLSQRVVRWWRSEVIAWLNTQRSTYAPIHPVFHGRTVGSPCPSIGRGRARRHH
jgi:hypothetical protein